MRRHGSRAAVVLAVALLLSPRLAAGLGQTQGTVDCVPSPVAFGDVVLGTGSVDSTVTCTNAGRVRVTIVAVEIAGRDAADFTAASAACLRTLSPGVSCEMQVTFAPGGVGGREATLTVRASPNTPAPPESVELRGTGIARVSTLVFEPAALAFGERLGGTTSPEQSVTATNTGTIPVAIGAVSIEDDPAGEFAVATSTCTASTLAPGASCQVSVAFTPRAPGGRVGTLRVDSDGTGSPHRLPLSGSGTVPAVLIDPAVGHAGTVTTVVGVGFPPAQAVTLQWLDAVALSPAGLPEPPAVALPDGAGAFRIAMLLLPKTAVGARTLRATGGAFVAEGPFLVVPGTAQAPDLVTRG